MSIYQRGDAFGVRVHRGDGQWEWVGSFRFKDYGGKREARRAAQEAELQALRRPMEREKRTVAEAADDYLAAYKEKRKLSSYESARYAINVFVKEHGTRRLDSITSAQAERFARERGWAMRAVSVFFNAELGKDSSPFRGLSETGQGRKHKDPPTDEELAKLLDACSVHGPYADRMRALVLFAAYSGMRPGEIFALRWADVHFDTGRVRVRDRVYGGQLDVPKSGRQRLISLIPPARDALMALTRDTELVFTTKEGRRFSQSLLWGYWTRVRDTADLPRKIDFYDLRHFAAHFLYVRTNLPSRVVAAQLGHSSPRLVEDLYGHFKVGALDEIDAAFNRSVTPLTVIRDASETQSG